MLAATWALKTTLVLQGTQSDKPIAPPDHFAHLRAQRQPPSNVTVWIGSHYRARFDPINTVYVQKPLSLEPLDDKLEPGHFGYVNFLAVGGLSFLVIGHPYRNRVVITCREPFKEALTKIWPPLNPLVAWPPELMMDIQLIDLLFLRNDPPTLDVKV